eukprot:TRINITY_DN2347_c0_g1_i5.p2 TRINITY_DN2347_c0_g1~~TRINITY_DN2347_c0_g1_i5.p2  ORF type:complete len:221 (+),score=-22.25 TRINITY_DN2347_c0_g1_i5:415-1077(+)
MLNTKTKIKKNANSQTYTQQFCIKMLIQSTVNQNHDNAKNQVLQNLLKNKKDMYNTQILKQKLVYVFEFSQNKIDFINPTQTIQFLTIQKLLYVFEILGIKIDFIKPIQTIQFLTIQKLLHILQFFELKQTLQILIKLYNSIQYKLITGIILISLGNLSQFYIFILTKNGSQQFLLATNLQSYIFIQLGKNISKFETIQYTKETSRAQKHISFQTVQIFK